MVEKDRHSAFSAINSDVWDDWKWQIANRIASIEQIMSIDKGDKNDISAGLNKGFSVGITPYYAIHLEHHALRKTIVPNEAESVLAPGEFRDPLGEENHQVTPHLIHTYPDKVLFLATSFCSTYCRYCTRSRMVGEPTSQRSRYEDSYAYIAAHSQIKDVLISGGDPLTMSDGSLDEILTALRAIPHVRIVRIGSKVPAVLPMRITPALCAILQRHQVWLSLHFTHPAELLPETQSACVKLKESGIPMLSQTVLLKGVNDQVSVLKELFYGLVEVGVKPYYLLQCDPVRGSAHFRTPVSTGIQIIKALHGYISGVAIPQFVIDAPGGGGKVPLLSEDQLERKGDYIYFKNYQNKTFSYPDPIQHTTPSTIEIA